MIFTMGIDWLKNQFYIFNWIHINWYIILSQRGPSWTSLCRGVGGSLHTEVQVEQIWACLRAGFPWGGAEPVWWGQMDHG